MLSLSVFNLVIVPRRETITRPRNESKDSKKARKAAVKAERQTRRIEKKTTKQQFGAEVKVWKAGRNSHIFKEAII